MNNRILLISNRTPFTGIGNYSYQLIKNFQQYRLIDFNFLNLATIAEDSYGGSIGLFSQKIKRLVDHLLFLHKIPKHYRVYHLLNPNLGILIAKYRPIVVTVHDIFPFTSIAKKIAITESHGLDIPILLAMKVNMKSVRNADRIITVSEHTKKDLTTLFRINPSRITVIHLGVDRNLYRLRSKKRARSHLNLPLDKKIILHVGVDEPRKNIRTLIEAFSIIKKKMPKTILIRVGGMRNITRRLITSFRLEGSVMHHSKVSNLALFYNAADVLAFPSYYEGFGKPVLEAMASGTPVIAGRGSSIPEVLGDSGIMIPPSDAKMLRDAICQVLTENQTRAEMIEKGLKRSLKFNWRTCADKTIKIYEVLQD
ncbi:MAG: glycosyltransferase family 4 protein [Candidatus Bathyarchaeota archaeon]|nr:MAG: glycosyltransferase family 4 protein [Candidatus Bathyarchaeota archaeon]